MSKLGPEGYFMHASTVIQATDGSTAAIVQTNLPDHLARPLLGTDATRVRLSPLAEELFGSGAPAQPSRSTSFSSAFRSTDPKAATWEPTGPKPRSSGGLNPDSGPWREAVDRPDLVARAEEGRQAIQERMAGLGFSPNEGTPHA